MIRINVREYNLAQKNTLPLMQSLFPYEKCFREMSWHCVLTELSANQNTFYDITKYSGPRNT